MSSGSVLQVLIDNLVFSPLLNLLVMVYIATVVEGMPSNTVAA